SDIGYRIATQYGMNVLPRRAGLVPFTLSGALKAMSERLSGLSMSARLTCGSASFLEQLLFTHRGLSGPVVLQLSSYWREGEAINIDLLPEMDAAELLSKAKQQQPRSLLRTILSAELPKKLVAELEQLWWPASAEKPLAEFTDKALLEIADQLNHWLLTPAGTEGYRTAEVTMGGVDTNDLSSKTMESKTRPNLYFIGEVVDVSGQLGGFNFQWAWSSGYVAGQSV
ncbi:MAG: aminoacetone oxidase family FAD-binding enzyme, partial [Gammaproteobacteria bacterium]|nr:aminoacetone oxidase family FAD-binding enzyme [Gammaproteobacteria bacterium]